MKVQVQLFGAFRDYAPAALVELELTEGACVADLRAAMNAYGTAHWPAFRPGLLQRSAFASETAVLREDDPLPTGGTLVILPPVAGG
ncbi:MAG TPA: MoaD/ThiS family protein [Rhodanobacteraceae bacterium]|nr:MoaD/ThiS family protein [Rhodanobacteraceae bacterium]